jgi:hypothetical protein
MKLYKLTTQDGKTQNNTQWSPGHTETKPGPNFELCSNSVLHAYRSLDLGLLLNPIHSCISDPLLWECEGKIEVEDWGKVGCSTLMTKKIISLPAWYTDRKSRKRAQVRFAILCAETVLKLFENQQSDDRPRKAINAAKAYLDNPTKENADAAGAAYAAARAADAAAGAAAYAAGAAADAAGAAYAAAYAASAAYAAARAAGAAADAAADANIEINFIKLAEKAVREVS